jgi:hypothetical protein
MPFRVLFSKVIETQPSGLPPLRDVHGQNLLEEGKGLWTRLGPGAEDPGSS